VPNVKPANWMLGNGMTLNVGADERRTKGIANLSNNVTTVGSAPTTAFAPSSIHAVVNFAVNQAWGRFAVSGIFNKNNATYYNDAAAIAATSDSGTRKAPMRSRPFWAPAAMAGKRARRNAAIRTTSGAGRCSRASTSRRVVGAR